MRYWRGLMIRGTPKRSCGGVIKEGESEMSVSSQKHLEENNILVVACKIKYKKYKNSGLRVRRAK